MSGILYFEIIKAVPSEFFQHALKKKTGIVKEQIALNVGGVLTAFLQYSSESPEVSTVSSESNSQSSECTLSKRYSAVAYNIKTCHYFYL